jgi:hypothetical protein
MIVTRVTGSPQTTTWISELSGLRGNGLNINIFDCLNSIVRGGKIIRGCAPDAVNPTPHQMALELFVPWPQG